MSRLQWAMAITALVVLSSASPGRQGEKPGQKPGRRSGTYTESLHDTEGERLRADRELPGVRARSRAIGLRSAGRFEEALHEAARVVEVGHRVGNVGMWQDGLEIEGRVLTDLGRYSEALPLLVAGTRTGGMSESLTDVALCRLKLGDLLGARGYDVQAALLGSFGEGERKCLPGIATSVLLEASLWLDRARSTEGHYLRSRWAMRAARICPTSVAANWVAAFELGCLGQRAAERKYLLRAAAGTPCALQGDAKRRLGWRKAEECKDRYAQGTMPPPPGEGIEPVPDP